MKYISNIDHRDISYFNSKYKEKGLNMKEKDYVLLEMLWNFAKSGNAKNFTDKGEIYYWFTVELISQQFPEWKLGRTSCYNRIARLVDMGLIARHPEGKTFQGYYSFTQRCQELESLQKKQTAMSDRSEIVDLHKEIAGLKKTIQSKTKALELKDEQIRELYETIKAQEALILELQGHNPKHQDTISDIPKDQPTLYQQCKEIYENAHAKYYSVVHSTEGTTCKLTSNQQKKLRELVFEIEDAVKLEHSKRYDQLPSDDDITQAFDLIMNMYIEMAKDKEFFYWADFTPANLLRNFSDFFPKIKTRIQNGTVQPPKHDKKSYQSSDEGKSGLEKRLAEIRGDL